MLAVLLCVAMGSVDGAGLQRRVSRLASFPSLLETEEAAGVEEWDLPVPDASSCANGPFRITDMGIKPRGTQKMTIASCKGDRVQDAITRLTVAASNGKHKFQVRTYVNKEYTNIFSSTGSKGTSCYNKNTGVTTSPANGKGSVGIEIKCLEKSQPCEVNVGYNANCGEIDDE